MVAQNISEAVLDVWATYFRIPGQILLILFPGHENKDLLSE
jgi:hypothetical protein